MLWPIRSILCKTLRTGVTRKSTAVGWKRSVFFCKQHPQSAANGSIDSTTLTQQNAVDHVELLYAENETRGVPHDRGGTGIPVE